MSIFNPIIQTRKRKGLMGNPIHKRLSYHNYLQTKSWKKLREAKVNEQPICQDCKSVGPLDTHHLTYIRVGGETKDDLVMLCRNCHYLRHKKKKRQGG